jgi:hypothetical protein
MAANQVVVYFERQEDAVLFTLAASSAMSAESAADEAGPKIAREISKASRITTEGALHTESDVDRSPRCA